MQRCNEGMDFSKFSDAEFDAKEWVNGALRAHKESQTPVDVSAGVGNSQLDEFLQLSLREHGELVML